MDVAQNAQKLNEKQRSSENYEHGAFSDGRKQLQLEAWIDFCAIGGLITNDAPEFEYDSRAGKDLLKNFSRMSVQQFAQQIGVPRRTLYSWKKIVPDFAMKVRKRREELWPVARETAIFNRLYLIGMSGSGQPSVTALTVLASHFSKLRLATQPHEVEAGENLTQLLLMARKKKIVEGEIADNDS
jgi:putative insertion element HTH domain-containing protein